LPPWWRIAVAVAAYLETDYDLGLASFLPTNMESFRETELGGDLFARGLCRESLRPLRRAVELASTNVAALFRLRQAYLNLGEGSQADSVLPKLVALKDRMTKYQQSGVEVAVASAEGLEARFRAHDRVMEQWPDFYGYNAGLAAIFSNRPQRAREFFLQWDQTTDFAKRWPLWHPNLAAALHKLNEHNAELEIAREGRQLFPESDRLLDTELWALAALGKIDEVDSLVTVALQRPATSGPVPAAHAVMVGMELRAHGYRDAANITLNRAVEWYQARPNEMSRLALGWAYAWQERWSEARDVFAAMVAAGADGAAIYGWLGVALAQVGDTAQARTLEQRLAQWPEPEVDGRNTRMRASIAAALGDQARGVSLLQQGYEEGEGYFLWTHRAIDLESLRGYPPFEAFVKPKD
jgi:tetratricopeptide (TPR) repeat protein